MMLDPTPNGWKMVTVGVACIVAVVVLAVVCAGAFRRPFSEHPGELVANADAPLHQNAAARIPAVRQRVEAASPATVQAPEDAPVNAGSIPSLVVVGQVVDGSGRPIPAASVAVIGVIGDGPALRADAVCDDEGRYLCRLASVAQGREIVLVASCPGYHPDKKTLVVEGGGRLEADWRLHPGRGVFGRVLSRGSAVVGAFATLVGRYSDGSIRTAVDRAMVDGRFAIGFHPAVCAEKVVVFHGRLGVAERPCLEFPLGGDLGDIELLPMEPLAAQLVNRSGQALSGLQLTVLRSEGNDLDGGLGGCFWDPVTDSSGAFVLYGMRAGRFGVFVGGTELSGFGGPVGQIETGAGQQTIMIPGARIVARAMRGQSDYPGSEVKVCWYRQTGGGWESDGLVSSTDRVVREGSVWRLDLVRISDHSVIASQVVDTGTQAFIEVTLRERP